MFNEEEVLRRFSNSNALEATVNCVAHRLEHVARLAAGDRAMELIEFSKTCARARQKLPELDNTNDPVDDDVDVSESIEPELRVDYVAETIADSLSPTIAVYDPAEAQRQLYSELPQSENSLESLLQVMVTPGYQRRALVVAEPGMSQTCRALMIEFPNLSAAVELIAGAVSLAERHHLPIQLPRLHIDGPPGCGKTQLLRRVADILHLPLVVISMSAVHGDFELVGCNRVYRGAEPGRLIKSLLALQVANPIFLFDEAELGHPRHYGPLLSFLEDPWFTDNFFEMPFRTEYVNKIFITNDAAMLSPAIRSRLSCIDVQQPTAEQMRTILQRLYTNLRLTNSLFVGFPVALDSTLIEALSKEPLRGARQLLEAALYRAACRQVDVSTLQLSLSDLVPTTHQSHFVFAAGHA